MADSLLAPGLLIVIKYQPFWSKLFLFSGYQSFTYAPGLYFKLTVSQVLVKTPGLLATTVNNFRDSSCVVLFTCIARYYLYPVWKCNLAWLDYSATPLISVCHMKVIEHTIALLGTKLYCLSYTLPVTFKMVNIMSVHANSHGEEYSTTYS